jgi:hypothetical protein
MAAWWALAVSIASLVVAIGALALSRSQWRRSGADLILALVVNRGPDHWGSVEVFNGGRMDAIVREVYLGCATTTHRSGEGFHNSFVGA